MAKPPGIIEAIENYKTALARQRRVSQQQQEQVDMALALAENCELPPMDYLRPATADDVIVGNVFLYPDLDGTNGGYGFWQVIAEVERPHDEFKAYSGEDGNRYGLDGAFVYKEVKKKR